MEMDTNCLFGTIRVIKSNENTLVTVAKDTDENVALCFKIFNKDNSKVLFGDHMGIDVYEENDPEFVSWLGRVVGRMLKDAYKQGYADKQIEASETYNKMLEAIGKRFPF